MDNLTHSLIGVALARALVRREDLRSVATWAAVFASSLPDIDLVLRPLFEDEKLGYLVHHRGHTHTVPVALALLPLALGPACWLNRVRFGRLDAAARRALVGLGVVSVLLHLVADSWNNYGVHPLWPLWSRWLYGDFIFIVEPLLMAALLPLVFADARSRAGKVVGGALLLGVLALAWFVPGLPSTSALLTTLVAGLLLLLQRAGPRIGLSLGAALLVLATFLAGSRVAKARLAERVARVAPGERVVEIGASPIPATPLCWSFLVQTRRDDTLSLYAGTLSLAPSLLPPQACLFRSDGPRTARLEPVPATTADVAWAGVARSSRSLLLARGAEDCRARAFLRFGRMPFWRDQDGGLVLGDLRYDFEPDLGFAELWLEAGQGWTDCSAYLAPWVPDPVRDLEAALATGAPAAR